MPVEHTPWAKSLPCLLSARPIKTCFFSFSTQLGETLTAETKLLLELSLRQLQGGSLIWSLFSVLQLLMEWTENGASLPAAGKASQANGDVGPHRWNFCNVKHKPEIFMEKET